MLHTRASVIERTITEFERLESLVDQLTEADWARLLPRPETKDPWTIKDALAHVTHWKAGTARSIRGEPRPAEERGLTETAGNRLVYLRWRDRAPTEVVAWHRQVQADVLSALRDAPDEWFGARQRRADWPFDLDGHSAYHRVKDMERALKG